jgi:hypothetical protein
MKKRVLIILIGVVALGLTTLFKDIANHDRSETHTPETKKVDPNPVKKTVISKGGIDLPPTKVEVSSRQADQSNSVPLDTKDALVSELKGSVSQYFETIKFYSQQKLARRVFEGIYHSSEKHGKMKELFSDLSKARSEFGEEQAQLRVFAVAYFDYIYKEKDQREELVDVLNSISDDIIANGNVKNRSLDLEDLLVSYLSKVPYSEFRHNPRHHLAGIKVHSLTDKFLRNALLVSYEDLGADVEEYKRILEDVRGNS